MRRASLHGRRPPRVYYKCLLVIGALLASVVAPAHRAGAQIELTVHSAMVKGPSTAPVTIIEFSDYQ